MKKGISILHLTAHLGGGIGRALSGLVLNTPRDSGARHAVVCLEKPEKNHFMEKIRSANCNVFVAPDRELFQILVNEADIIQLEWWNHPATIAALCEAPLPAMRLIIWCHVSGLQTPVIPAGLISAAHRCLFTSPCSYEATEVQQLPPETRNRLDAIHSTGGFDDFVPPNRPDNEALTAGYVGSLNFAKLHPHYADFLAAVPIHGFRVRMIGDMTNREVLQHQCEKAGRQEMLEFRGYTDDVASELAAINVTPYLLNPNHYGTTENALLEAMAMGVVPVVLDNPAERCLVRHGETGLIVNSPEEFAAAITWLADNPAKRTEISRRAAKSVRERFSPGKTAAAFSRHYLAVIEEEKTAVRFRKIFGDTPADWFLACQRNKDTFLTEQGFDTVDEMTIPGLLERTKGSSFHFHRNFPEDMRLSQWTNRLKSLM